jgi:penicillin G amidase
VFDGLINGRRWGMPSENQVYADTAGNIGWIPGGRTPVRPNWDGLMPIPGDGRYEWNGFLGQNELPQSFNPPEGFIATTKAAHHHAPAPGAAVKVKPFLYFSRILSIPPRS